jgi:sulfate adenylyltransferase subunit 1 (EFTu-like GTPase family)
LKFKTPEKLVKISTVGSVNSGKSSVLGRLVEHLDPTESESTQPHLLFDGLSNERENQLTFRVGYRFANRGDVRWCLIDDPGHAHLLPVTISGIYQSDIVLYIISKDQFQLQDFKIHMELLQWLGKKNVLFVLNKYESKLSHDEFFVYLRELINEYGWSESEVIRVNARNNSNIKKQFFSGDNALLDHLDVQLKNILAHQKISLEKKTAQTLSDALLWETPHKNLYLNYYGNKYSSIFKREIYSSNEQINYGELEILDKIEIFTHSPFALVVCKTNGVVGLAKLS